MMLVQLQHFLLALESSASLDLDEQSMSAWARFAVNIAYLLIGGVLGAGASRKLQQGRIQSFSSGLSAEERAALAAKLAQQGSMDEAAMLSSTSLQSSEAQASMLAALSAEERAAVAARLAGPTHAVPGSIAGWNTEPPARLLLSSQAVHDELRAEAQARREAAQAAGAEYVREAEQLLKRWEVLQNALEDWVRLPAEDLLERLDAADGPAEALRQLEEQLPLRSAGGSLSPMWSNIVAEISEEAGVARLVLDHSRSALAPGVAARARSLQIANAAQYVLHEMPRLGEGGIQLH